ncbi:hypothetical protein TcasGA2_TC003469 [Tribolium castaneum]|uniref:Uncharacterized protein n=1 Tax=Tribolium castaneum TaxID=7070 RepID=D6WGW1_TRICA|nr:hypothetical protein TcasGA2_TC003469 [Tribolium castaneum]
MGLSGCFGFVDDEETKQSSGRSRNETLYRQPLANRYGDMHAMQIIRPAVIPNHQSCKSSE